MYAPEPLETVRRFVNTRDIDRADDLLTSPAALADWAAGAGLVAPGRRFDRGDLDLACEVREGLRALLVINNGQPDPEDVAAAERLGRVVSGVSLRAGFEAGRPALVPAGRRPVDTVVGRLLAIVTTAAADGSWARLKACRADGCRWAFYDQSRNRSGTWCSMSTCGNAAKQRAYQARQRRTGLGQRRLNA